jgi:hypothetical protein
MIDYICFVGWDSSVGIATGYGMDGPGIESPWGRDFPRPSKLTWGNTSHLYTGSEFFPRVKRSGRGVDFPSYLAPRLRKDCSYNSTPYPGLRGLF